jgi:glycine hydroxymethyltransferase
MFIIFFIHHCATATDSCLRSAATKNEEGARQIKELKRDVVAFARRWPLPGVDVNSLTRPAGIEEDD